MRAGANQALHVVGQQLTEEPLQVVAVQVLEADGVGPRIDGRVDAQEPARRGVGQREQREHAVEVAAHPDLALEPVVAAVEVPLRLVVGAR